MTFDEWWKTTKPAECDEVKEHFEEAWRLAFLEGYQRGIAGYQEAVMSAHKECAAICDKYNDGRHANMASLCAADIRALSSI